MATTRIMPLHCGKGRTVGRAISDILDYVKNPEKTDHGNLITSYQCNSRIADAEFLFAKQQYIQKTGRVRGADDVIAYHLRQSFRPGEITPEEANRLGCELASRFTKGNHAYIVCTHIDKAHVHNHIIWTAITLTCDRKFQNFWGSAKAVRRLNDTICIQNGYSIVENPKGHGKSYDKWLGDQAKPSHRELLRIALDNALAEKPKTLEALLQLLRDAGWEIKSGKEYSFRMADWKRFVHMDTLGADYTKDALLAVLKGEKSHAPRKRKSSILEPPRLQLAIDIQAKFQEGKGAGYARFASVFNLKQMAQAMNYIQEHHLEYGDLAGKFSEATAQYNTLSAQIKAAEKRMGEISVLRKHIINYSKTREVYVAYRKSGYSKDYLAEHESEILLHRAAKKAFDELGLSKIPTKKSLDLEYAQLLEEKKEAYGQYRQARDEMKELTIIKHNIDKLLGYQNIEKNEPEQEH